MALLAWQAQFAPKFVQPRNTALKAWFNAETNQVSQNPDVRAAAERLSRVLEADEKRSRR